jgi:hypothetical protein
MTRDLSGVTYVSREPFHKFAAATLELHLKVLSDSASFRYSRAFKILVIVGQYSVPHATAFQVAISPSGFPNPSLQRRCVGREGRGGFFSETVLVFERSIKGSAGRSASALVDSAGSSTP